MIGKLSLRRAAIGAAAALGLSALAAVAWVLWPLPAGLLDAGAANGLVIEDRNGLVLRSTRAADGSDARWVPYDRIDPDVIGAFVAVEDRRFWEHHGIDARAVARAVRENWRAGRVASGASTITMQLARLLRPTRRSWGGKLGQALWALRLERHLSKQRILEQYLNRVQLGQGVAGVGAASTLYFATSASELSIGQAATLAGLAHAPSRDNPRASPKRARERQALALRRMRRLGAASAADVERARVEPLTAPRAETPFAAPHFTTRVLSWAADERPLTTEGGRVRTSLDLDLQTALEAEVRHTVDVLHDRGVQHAAAVVLDNETGEVLAWVGSPDFWSPDEGQTDMVVSPRQPGSALKPFLYALALDRGFTAATVLPDIPKTYATPTGPYHPRDYDRRFRGPTRAREALASSYNVPAVELASRLGASSLLRTLHLAGFASLRRDAEYYGLGLALGDGDVTLLELANGYRALANGGEWRAWTWRTAETRDPGPLNCRDTGHGTRDSGTTARDVPGPCPSPASRVPCPACSSHGRSSLESRRFVSQLASALVLDILADPAARMPAFGVSTPFDFPFPVAVKTGTSRHFTDNWAVGTTRNFTVAVWAGNFSGKPMQGVSGVTGAGPLLHRAVMVVAQRIPPGALTTPAEAGAVSVPVCRLSGLLATRECASLAEWFAPGTAPSRTDDWERGGHVTLPDEYAEWARQGPRPVAAGVTLASAGAGSRPAGGDWFAAAGAPVVAHPVAEPPRPARDSRFHIVSPLDGDHYGIPPGVEARYATISLHAGGRGAAAVRWSVDGKPFAGERWPLVVGPHEIRAVSARGDTASVRVTVEP